MSESRINLRNINLLLIFLFPIFFLIFGIKKQNEIHEKLMIQGIGIDLDENENYKITVQAYDFKNPEDKNNPRIRTLECHGQSVSESLENLKKSTGLYPMYSQNRIIIFGSTLAKKGIKKAIDFFSRYYENRPSVKLRVAKEKAEDIIKSKIDGKIIKSSEIRDLVDEKSDTNILDFEKSICTPYSDPSMFILEKNENEIICENLAIFNNDSMIEIFDKYETMALMIIKNAPKIGIYSFKMKDNLVSCNLENAKTKIKADIVDNIPVFYIESKLKAILLESYENFGDVKSIESEIKNELNKNLKNLCEKSINKSLSNKCDIFKFGKILRNKNPKYFKSIEWKNILGKIKFEINVSSEISVVGTDNK